MLFTDKEVQFPESCQLFLFSRTYSLSSWVTQKCGKKLKIWQETKKYAGARLFAGGGRASIKVRSARRLSSPPAPSCTIHTAPNSPLLFCPPRERATVHVSFCARCVSPSLAFSLDSDKKTRRDFVQRPTAVMKTCIVSEIGWQVTTQSRALDPTPFPPQRWFIEQSHAEGNLLSWGSHPEVNLWSWNTVK